jgi:hypothetical protein
MTPNNRPNGSIDTTLNKDTRAGDSSYANILRHILKVADQHKKNTSIKTFFGALPILIAVTCLFIIAGYSLTKGSSFAQTGLPLWVVIILCVALFSLFISPLWIVTFSRISKIEYVIWVKSYFDKDDDGSTHSWSRALSLFWPSVRLSIGVFMRHYCVFWFIILASFCLLIYALIKNYQSIAQDQQPNFALILLLIFSPIITIICYYIYSQFVAIKTRYLQIILVNTYKTPTFSYAQVFKANDRLVKLDTTNGKSFNQLLFLSVGVDATVSTAIGVSANTVATVGASTAGIIGGKTVGGATGTLVQMYGAEATILTELLAQTMIFYVYYLSASGTMTTEES